MSACVRTCVAVVHGEAVGAALRAATVYVWDMRMEVAVFNKESSS